MSQLVHNRLDSGLVVASQAADESSVRRALKQHDPALMLTPDNPGDGPIVWTVLKRVGEGAHVVCRYRDEHGNPLPLSHGLVEHVKRLDLNSRAPRVDALEENDRFQQKIREEDSAELEAYAAELVERLRGKKSHNLPRGRYRRRTDFANVTGIR